MTKIKQAMILAAGMGSRMGELTKDLPKPMLIVDKISLIERVLTYLQQNQITKIVINTHYKAELLENFIKSLPVAQNLELHFSHEKELLGTGGGVKNALPFFSNKPFFILNSDSIFVDTDRNSFAELESNWQPEIMPMLMLLSRKDKSFGYWAKGNFNRSPDGKLNNDGEIHDFIYTGMCITDYRLYDNYHNEAASFNLPFKDLIQKNKLYGIIYSGNWYHIGDKKAYDIFPGFNSLFEEYL